MNIIPRDGGNRFSGTAFFNYANAGLQGNNVDDELRAQGVATADSIKRINDASFAIGGPIKRDKLWFWTAHRFWGYEQIRTNTFYEKQPARLRVRSRSAAGPAPRRRKTAAWTFG